MEPSECSHRRCIVVLLAVGALLAATPDGTFEKPPQKAGAEAGQTDERSDEGGEVDGNLRVVFGLSVGDTVVTSHGFIPMALSTSAGAEVQRTVATSTLLTLFLVPMFCHWVGQTASMLQNRER